MTTNTYTTRTYSQQEIQYLLDNSELGLPEGYNGHDYFDAEGRYLGPDEYGVEPSLDWEVLDQKDEVSNWETVDAYYSEILTGMDGEPGLVTVEVQIGSNSLGWWYGKTTDDAGGPDDAPVGPIAFTRANAEAWAEEFVSEMDESPDEDSLIKEILAFGWFDESVDGSRLREIADCVREPGKDSCHVWVSNYGGTHLDFGGTIRVEGWERYIVVGPTDGGRIGALMKIGNLLDYVTREEA